MPSLLFVCLGNICRSPLAEGVMRDILKKEGLDEKVKVDSAGILGFHAGEKPDPRTLQNAKTHQIDMKGIVSRPFDIVDFKKFDQILAFDKRNFQALQCLAKTEEEKGKIDYFRNLHCPGENLEVPDPYYGDSDVFEGVFQIILQTCNTYVRLFKTDFLQKN